MVSSHVPWLNLIQIKKKNTDHKVSKDYYEMTLLAPELDGLFDILLRVKKCEA